MITIDNIEKLKKVNELSKELLSGKISEDDDLILDVFDGKFVFRKPIEKEMNGRHKEEVVD